MRERSKSKLSGDIEITRDRDKINKFKLLARR